MKIICIGDSNTWGYDPRSFWGEQYPSQCRWTDILGDKIGATIVNEGENGRKTTDFSEKSYEDADYIVVMLGTNDILEGKTASETKSNMSRFLEKIPCKLNKAILIAPPALALGAWVSDPEQIMQSKLLGQEYAALSRILGVRFVDAVSWEIPLCYDGVHFTEEGHRRFAEIIADIFDI